jgi:hypothetical protein
MFYLLLNKPKPQNKWIIRGCAIFIFLVLSLSLILQFIDNHLFSVFVKNDGDSILTVSPGVPSIMTCVSFYLISYFGAIRTSASASNFISKFLTIISVTAIIGYILKIPSLYYYVPEVSTATSIITAFSIFLLSLIILPQHNKS